MTKNEFEQQWGNNIVNAFTIIWIFDLITNVLRLKHMGKLKT